MAPIRVIVTFVIFGSCFVTVDSATGDVNDGRSL